MYLLYKCITVLEQTEKCLRYRLKTQILLENDKCSTRKFDLEQKIKHTSSLIRQLLNKNLINQNLLGNQCHLF